MNDIRGTIHEIHQDSFKLATSIEQLQRDLPSIQMHYQETIQSGLKHAFKVDLLAIIREAILNSFHHSNATQVQIVLHEYAGVFKLMIKDNGSDFDPEAKIVDGIGQAMIRQLGQKYQASTIIRHHNGYLTQLIFDKDSIRDELTQEK